MLCIYVVLYKIDNIIVPVHYNMGYGDSILGIAFDNFKNSTVREETAMPQVPYQEVILKKENKGMAGYI